MSIAGVLADRQNRREDAELALSRAEARVAPVAARCDFLRDLAVGVLGSLGYRRPNRGAWQKRRGACPASAVALRPSSLRSCLAKALGGDTGAASRLASHLAADPSDLAMMHDLLGPGVVGPVVGWIAKERGCPSAVVASEADRLMRHLLGPGSHVADVLLSLRCVLLDLIAEHDDLAARRIGRADVPRGAISIAEARARRSDTASSRARSDLDRVRWLRLPVAAGFEVGFGFQASRSGGGRSVPA